MNWKSEFLAGLKSIAPVLVAAMPIGLVFGAVAAGKGLSPLETLLMSALVFAGGSQFVAMDIWTHPASWTTLGFAAFPRQYPSRADGRLSRPQDGGLQALAEICRCPRHGGRKLGDGRGRARKVPLTPAFFAGLSVLFYLNWLVCSLAGALLGAVLGDPALIGLDFAFPAVFIVLVMSFWKGPATGLVLLASALASITVYLTVPGAWYIAAGAAAGLVAAFGAGRFRKVAVAQ